MKSTEEKIKEVARKLFLEKGFKHTTIREIAKEAEVNISLMNYYFRSKDKLFQQILEEGLGEIAPVIRKVLEADMPLEAKIKKYIDEYTDLLIQKPDLPLFVLSEMRLDPARFSKFPTLLPFTSQKLWLISFRKPSNKGKSSKLH